MREDGADEDEDSPSDGTEPRHRLILRLALYALLMMALIYLGCEIVVFLFHIKPSPDATVMLPALV